MTFPSFSWHHKKVSLLLIMVSLILNSFSQEITNAGTDFWLTFPPMEGNPQLTVYISSEYETNGTITSSHTGIINEFFTVKPGIVTRINIPTDFRLVSGIEDKGIHIITEDRVSVYGLSNQTASADAYMSLPTSSLGTDYFVLSYTVFDFPFFGGGLCVVGTVDGTNVEIYDKVQNTTFNIILNQGETAINSHQ